MLAFRHFMAVSTGATIALVYCLAASSQELATLSDSQQNQAVNNAEADQNSSPPIDVTLIKKRNSSIAWRESQELDKLTTTQESNNIPVAFEYGVPEYLAPESTATILSGTNIIPLSSSDTEKTNDDFLLIEQVNLVASDTKSEGNEDSTIVSVEAPEAEEASAQGNPQKEDETILVEANEDSTVVPVQVIESDATEEDNNLETEQTTSETPTEDREIPVQELLREPAQIDDQTDSLDFSTPSQEQDGETEPEKDPQLLTPEETLPLDPSESKTDFEGISVPDSIQPSGNTLLFPTDPEEVQIDQVYAITLEQVIELTRRNNRDFQVAQLQLDQARQQLEEALASQFPTLSTQLTFSRADSARGQITAEANRRTARDQREQAFSNADTAEANADLLDEQNVGLQQQLDTLQDQIINQPDSVNFTDVLNADNLQQQIFDNQDQANAFRNQAEDLRNDAASISVNDDTISTEFNGSINLNYELYTGGRRAAQIKAAEESIRLQELEVERISEQVRFDSITAYYNLQDSDAQVAIQQGAVEDATQSLRDAELLEQAGLGTRFDVLRAQVDLANSNQNLSLAVANQRTAKRQLVELLSIAQQVELTAADDIEVAGSWDLSLEETIVLAYKNRAELEQFLVNRDISEQQRRIAISAILPQVSLSASYNFLDVFDDSLGPGDGLTLAAQLNWQFFDGGAAKAQAEQSRLDGDIAEVQFANQRNEVRLQVETAYFDLQANQDNIQTASVAVELAVESLRLARLRFQAGVGTQTDVINAQTELTRARGNLLSAIIDYNQALNSLRRAVSNLPDNNLFEQP